MAAALQADLATHDDTMWGGRGGRRRAAGSPRGRGSHEGAGGTGGCGARGWACFKGGGTPIRLRSGQVPPPLRIPLLVQRGRDGSRGALRQGQDRLRPRPTERRTAGGDGYPRPTATAERRTAGGGFSGERELPHPLPADGWQGVGYRMGTRGGVPFGRLRTGSGPALGASACALGGAGRWSWWGRGGPCSPSAG